MKCGGGGGLSTGWMGNLARMRTLSTFLGQLFQPTCSFKFDKSFTLQTGDFFSLTVEFLTESDKA